MKGQLQSFECGACGSNHRFLLHNVRHRGSYRRLCTNCILKTHQGHFCPICLHVYDTSPPPPHARLTCIKCPSICHISCASSSSTFVCPPCSNPNFAFFKVNGDAQMDGRDDKRVMDVGSAKALVASAKIAAFSMSKAAAVARVEAERKVKEAALAKKRAREALERLLYMAADEKERDLKKVKSINAKHGGDKSSNGLHSLSTAAAGRLQRQGSNHGGVGN
ncbi:hypothetical protein ACOSP7_007824 [Xanthoceras sorbifolium]|uniref:Uncharacterized protein n=1 Tax=Xanthoceras sorbifolium TaxID=99658 RepID=A0ABQ8GXJ2_9ROSI|nr:hypothetical protein JRO89_XSUnG0176000 [Xanthoceras sorbifolium]